jgi:hypothetical protein
MITDFRDLTQRDYAESWGWVHFMLNSSNEASEVLLRYLEELQTKKVPRRLLPSLEAAVPSFFTDLPAHISRLQANQAIVGTP